MDLNIFQLLAAPITASLIIAGIHAYLGLHVVERGVIFVDLSLAQIASLGAAIAVWQGSDPHDPVVYWASLGFTLIGALIFSVVKAQKAKDSPGSVHRHFLRRRFCGRDPDAQQGDGRVRAFARHARRQHRCGAVARGLDDGGDVPRHRHLSLRLQKAISGNFDGFERRGGSRRSGAALGLPVLCVLWPGRDAFGGDCGRSACILLSDRAVGRRHAVGCRASDLGSRSAG